MKKKIEIEYCGYKLTSEYQKNDGFWWTEILCPNGESVIVDGYTYEPPNRVQAIAEIEKYCSTLEVF